MTFTIPLDLEDIKKCIPHREPFLLIDQIIEFEYKKTITAQRQTTPDDPLFKGHFPGKPVYPGVLLIEGMAQTSGVFGTLIKEDGYKDMFLTEVIHSRFRKLVTPNDLINYKVELIKHKGSFFWFKGQALVNEKEVAEVSFSAMMR